MEHRIVMASYKNTQRLDQNPRVLASQPSVLLLPAIPSSRSQLALAEPWQEWGRKAVPAGGQARSSWKSAG